MSIILNLPEVPECTRSIQSIHIICLPDGPIIIVTFTLRMYISSHMVYWSIELNMHLERYTYTEQELCEMGAKVISATVVEDKFYRRFGDRGFMYNYPNDERPEINAEKPIECYKYRLDPEFIKGGVFLNEAVYKFLYYGAINYIRDEKIDQLI